MSRVTIKDLANASGLSVCTINKALNGKPWVSEATRRRVIVLAKEMGYTPNRLAQALARRTLNIGIVAPTFWGDWFGPLLAGVRQGVDQLQDHNIVSQFRTVDGDPESNTVFQVMRELIAEGVDGIVVCAGYPLGPVNQLNALLQEHPLPLVLLGGDNPGIPYLACVRADARRCGRLAGEMLGLLTGKAPSAVLIGNSAIVDHQEKAEGFSQEARRHPFPVVECLETHDDPGLAYIVTAQLMQRYPQVRGLYVATDYSAEGVCRYLVEQGLTDTIKVLGTGVFPAIRSYMEQGIVQATLYQSMLEQGRQAVQLMYGYLSEGIRPEQHVLVPPHLALRNSIDLWAAEACPVE